MHALKVLKKDHSDVQSLFNRLERLGKSAQEKKNEIFAEIRRALQLHSRAEEEIFYPALKVIEWRRPDTDLGGA